MISSPHDSTNHLHEITVLIYRSYSDIATAKLHNPKLNASPEMGNDRKANLCVTNAYNLTPSPEARLKSQGLSNRHIVNSSISGDMRERSESFVLKARNNKQLKILGNAISSENACTELLENQNQLISEFKSRNKSKAGPESENEVGAIHAAQTEFVDSADRITRSTVEQVQKSQNMISNDRKPIAYVSKFVCEPNEDHADAIYVNNCVSNNNDYDKDNIYENVNSKQSQDVVDTNTATKNDYVTMNGNNNFHRSHTFTGTSIKPDILAKSLENNEYDCEHREDYVTMSSAGLQERSLSVQLNKTDLVHLRGAFGCIYESLDYSYIYELNPLASSGKGQPFTKTKQEIKPMPCYCHEDPDREKKVQRKIIDRARQMGGSQNTYFSCEEIYVTMKNKEGIYSSLNELNAGYIKPNKIDEDEKESTWIDYTAKNDASLLYKFDDTEFNESNQAKSSTLDAKMGGILKKKLCQVKQLLSDW